MGRPASALRGGRAGAQPDRSTANLLTLCPPASGQVRVKGVTSAATTVLHPWLETELTASLATLPEPPAQAEAERRAAWARWQHRGMAAGAAARLSACSASARRRSTSGCARAS